jgi:hypothetical protein
MKSRMPIPLLIAAVALLVPAGLQASDGLATASAKAGSAAERATGQIAYRGKGKRPGCRRFCQQAGGFGECTDTPEECNPVEMPDQTVGGTRDRVVAVRATCTLDHDCVGAIILTSFKGDFGSYEFPGEYGRADLEIPAGETRKVKVGISKAGLAYLKKHGDDRSAFATAPLVPHDPPDPASISGDITVLAP